MIKLFSIGGNRSITACPYCKRTKVLWDGNIPKTKSCGCVTQTLLSTARTVHGCARGKKTPEYKAWIGMKYRCYNPSYSRYGDWGGRGIRVCKKWRKSFAAFMKDMGRKPRGTVLDRINNNGNYTPKNCRWATLSQSNKNRRRFRP